MSSTRQSSNLLLITDRYPHNADPVSASFVYLQVDELKKYFNYIYVISLNPFIPKFLSKFSFMNPRWQKDAFAKDYNYDNVEVRFVKYFMLPFDFLRKRKGYFAYVATKNLRKLIEQGEIEFNLIHAHTTLPSGYVGAKFKELYKKQLIITIHEQQDQFSKAILSMDKRLLYSWCSADKIIRVNKIDLRECIYSPFIT